MKHYSLNEDLNLIPIKLYHDDGFWELRSEKGNYSIKASDESMRRLLLRIDARDSEELPNSLKTIPYSEMINKAKDKGKYQIFVWKSNHPKDLEHLKSLME